MTRIVSKPGTGAPRASEPSAGAEGSRPRTAAGGAGGGHPPREAAGQVRDRARLLEDKLQVPRLTFPVLARPRVTALLESALRRRVTLVSAPAGAGKTVACASWARATGRRVVWLSLGDEDDSHWFWAYLRVGMERAQSAPDEVLRGLEDCSPRRFPLALVQMARRFTEPVVVVLDDLHEITDPAVLAGLDALIRHAPDTLRLVLATRRQPGLQLARLRVAGEVADIGSGDLACTPQETQAYFSMLGIAVDARAREEVLRRTEGWMAGLRLVAMRAGQDGEIRAGGTVAELAGDEPMVTDYLWDEVLAGQPPQTRSFLQRTSIVPELPGDLAQALTGQAGGARILERLSRENNFVQALRGGRSGYRYHPLLRDALMAGLQREMPQEIAGLRRRAADWYAGQGRALEAVTCAVTAQDWDYAVRALAQFGIDLLMARGPEELEAVLARLPPDREAGDVAVATAWAAARLWSNDLEAASAHLESAQRALAHAEPSTRGSVEPTLAAVRLLQAAEQDRQDPDLVGQGWALAERSQESARSQAEHRAVGALWFALGMACLRRWEITDARHALSQADHQLGVGRLADLRSRTRAWRALAEACYGDLARAAQAADEVRKLAIPASRETAALVTLAYAEADLARDEVGAAQRLLAEADPSQMGHLPGEPPPAVIAALARARAWIADGDVAAGRAALSRLRSTWHAGRPPLSQTVTVTEAEAALAAGDTGRARALLLLADEGAGFARPDLTLAWASLLLADGAFTDALAAVRPYLTDAAAGRDAVPAGALRALTARERTRALLVAAVAHRRLGDSESAAELLERALDLAEPAGAYRVFLDAGAAVRSAVTVLVPPTSRHAGFAGRVLERFDAQGARVVAAADRSHVRLTDSERAVLCFLPSHMTNEEISGALFLSVNTVKTHLRSAYRKLGVGSRRAAIAQGRRLGLLLGLPGSKAPTRGIRRLPRRGHRPCRVRSAASGSKASPAHASPALDLAGVAPVGHTWPAVPARMRRAMGSGHDLRRPGSDAAVKTDVEELSPTRVKLTIEVPFEELKSSLDKAYREVSKQVRIPGFRPGHVPPRIIDQRLGRGAVLEQAINDAVPQLYGKALADNDVFALGQPDLEITQLDDGQQLAFTAEVDVRPKFELPAIEGLPVTVDDAEVGPDEVEEYIGAMRERFASLKGVDRPAQTGDYVSIDLSASVDGRQVEDAQASGLSYEVGSGTLLDGLDEALLGMSAGDTGTFTAVLAGGQQAGAQAEVAVTVHSVKVKELPDLDDEFAQSASEFDTIGEFRAGTRARLEGLKRMQQAAQARDRAMDALLARVEIPLPERLVAQEIEGRERSLAEQLERMGTTREAYLESRGITAPDLDAEITADARRAVKAGFILDQIARQEKLGVEQDEINSYVIEQAYRIGVPPDRLASQIVDQGQVPMVVGEVLRGKALRLLAERAAVTDESGRPVDLKAAAEEASAQSEPADGESPQVPDAE